MVCTQSAEVTHKKENAPDMLGTREGKTQLHHDESGREHVSLGFGKQTEKTEKKIEAKSRLSYSSRFCGYENLAIRFHLANLPLNCIHSVLERVSARLSFYGGIDDPGIWYVLSSLTSGQDSPAKL